MIVATPRLTTKRSTKILRGCLLAMFVLAASALASFSAPKARASRPLHNNNQLALSADNLEGWQSLPNVQYLDARHDIRYFQFTTEGSAAHLIVFDPDRSRYTLLPAINNPGCPVSETVKREQAIAGVNAGYFNLKDGQSAGYITINGKQICDPHQNAALTGNIKLQPYLAQIFNRSELRLLINKNGRREMRIQPHNDPLPPGYILKHAIQAGPQLLPAITSKEEAFIRIDPDGTTTDAIGSGKTAARTAFGITKNGLALLLCIDGKKQDEFSSGITLQALGQLLKRLGCINAINFDGGTSSTMIIHSPKKTDPVCINEYIIVCGKSPETKIKSVLLIKQEDN